MKRVLLIALMAFLSFSLVAQVENDISIPRTLRTGKVSKTEKEHSNRPDFFLDGNMNSNFGQMFSLNLSGGIAPAEWLRLGVGPRYELYYDGDVRHAVGASAYSEFVLVNYIVAHLGYEFLNYPTYEMTDDGRLQYDNDGKVIPCRKNIHALVLGVGFQTYLTESVSLYAQYLVYPLQTKNFHYSNFLPMFARIGVLYNF